MQAAVPINAKPVQVDKALDLLRDGGIVPVRRLRAFRCVSSTGTARYLVAPEACTCPAGLTGRLCYHRIAVLLLTS